MPASLAATKMCVCLVGGALIGGAAVKVVEKPRTYAVKSVKKIPKRPAAARSAAAPLPCEPMMTPTLAVEAPAALYGPRGWSPSATMAPTRAAILPLASIAAPRFLSDASPGGLSPPVAGTTAVPEPAALGLFGFGAAAVMLRRRRTARRSPGR